MPKRNVAAARVGRRIFHIAYYDALLKTRTVLLQKQGYTVSSALGNEQAKAAAATLLTETDAVLIGFSGTYEQRAAMLRWLKEQYRELPVLVLQSRPGEEFQQADGTVAADTPETWLAALAGCIRGRGHDQLTTD